MKVYTYKEEERELNLQIDSYLEKEYALAKKQGRIYFIDLHDMYKKNITLLPFIKLECCYYDNNTSRMITKFCKDPTKPPYLYDPYDNNFGNNLKDRQKLRQIGSITEKFFKEGKVEREFIPGFFKPYIFDMVVAVAFFVKAINKAD